MYTLLKEFILLEARGDNVVTSLSRQCISAIVSFVKNTPEGFRHDTVVSMELPIILKGSRVGILEFNLGFYSQGNPRNIKMREASYGKSIDDEAIIEIHYALPFEILGSDSWKKWMPSSLLVIKGLIQHELQHAIQAIQKRPAGADITKNDLDGWVTYLTDPGEVEAFVSEVKRKCQMMGGKPMSYGIEKAVENRLRNFSFEAGYADALKHVVSVWTDYAMKRYPEARPWGNRRRRN